MIYESLSSAAVFVKLFGYITTLLILFSRAFANTPSPIQQSVMVPPKSLLTYTAALTGVDDPAIRGSMINASAVLSAPSKETPSIHALYVRAESELPSLQNIAAYHGYYDCKIDVHVSDAEQPHVTIRVDLGKRFSFHEITIVWTDEDLVQDEFKNNTEKLYRPSLTDVPLFHAGQAPSGKAIALLEAQLVEVLRQHGYAFAKILRKDLVVSRKEASVDVNIFVQTGPVVYFGKTHIIGNKRVLPEFFQANQEWKTGALFNPKYLYRTEKALRESGLFQTVQVEEVCEASDNWTVPINIIVTENKPRTIQAGLSYTSTYGAGVTGQWEHRNIAGYGQRLSTKLEIWQRMQTALFSLTIPNFSRNGQDLLWVVEYDQQTYMPFTSRTIKGSVLLDREINRKSNIVYGVCLQRLESTGIIGHRLYRLFKTPLQYKWSNVKNLLDPVAGAFIHLRLTPSWQIVSPHYTYLIQNTTFGTYSSFFDESLTLAAKACIANIFNEMHNTIPLPDKFFGGSDSSLRGYKTGSVSPTNNNGKLIGGRSMTTLSLEARLRGSGGLGYVAFYDVGQVFRGSIPSLHRCHLLQSVGTGLRYATPIGPLRLDIAFPLNRRAKIDPPFQLYFSIGQAF